MIILILVCYIFTPLNYTIHNKGVIINRLIGKIYIEYKDILSIEQIINPSLNRIIGNGGCFGFSGLWMNIGNCESIRKAAR